MSSPMHSPRPSPLLVAEVSSNHGRSRPRALDFIHEAARIGCEAVKFQQFRIHELFAPSALAQHPELLDRIEWELPESLNAELAQEAQRCGLEFHSTPFYRRAVEVLEPLVDRFKLASYQLLWHDLLASVASTGKPVVLATGMATLDEVRAAVDVLGENGCRELDVLHCVSLYPTPSHAANLRAIATLRSELGVPVGWSDHTRDLDVVERAVQVHGATFVELHLDLDGTGQEYAGGHCWLPSEVVTLRERLDAARDLPAQDVADGHGRKEPHPDERHERGWRTDPSDGLRPLITTRLDEGLPIELDPRSSRLCPRWRKTA